MAERWDWAGISNDAVKEMTRQAEIRLEDILNVSSVADQRATTLSAIFAGIGAGVAAAGGTYATLMTQRAKE